jgi:hypothetical protein
VANKAIRALNADAQKNHSQTMGRKCRSTAKAPATQEVEHPGEPQVVEFPWISLYSVTATRLSAGFSVCAPAGGEMSGPKAHFLFAAKVARKP